MSINLSNIKSENFCVAPWINIHIGIQGDIKPCCRGSPIFGSLKHNNWSYIDGSSIGLKNLRNEMLSGIKPDYCNGCIEKDWYNEFLNEDIQINSKDDFNLKSVDIRWGNTCQLSCTYCNDFNSSTWEQLRPVKRTRPRMFKDQIQPLFQLLERNKDSIKRVSLVGGEPLLLNENVDLLHLLPESVSIEVITNLNVNLSNNKIYQLLIKRKNVNWYVSMENTESRFEFVRRRANWATQVGNLTKLSQEIDNHSQIKLQSQYCVYSALNLEELYVWAKEFSNVEVNLVAGLTRPDVLNIFLFPDSFKQQAQKELDRLLARNDLTCFERSAIETVMQKLLSSLGHSEIDIVHRCVVWHSAQESRYFNNQFNFLTLWPQYRA